MHILIIHQAFASLDEPGGTRHHEFARLLAGRGHRITVIASPVNYITGAETSSTGRREGRGADDGISILRARVHTAHHKSFFHRLIAFFSFMFSSFLIGLRVKDVDLVWGTSPPIFQGLTAWALARWKRAKLLFEVRDLWPQFAIAVGVLRNGLLIRLSEWLERFLYRGADLVVVNSPGYSTHVSARGAREVVVIPNGADPDMFDPLDSGAAFRASLNLEGKFIALYAGAHGISNDLDVVLEAARMLGDTDIRIVLVGDGKEKPALQRRAAQLGLANVVFAPSMPKSQIPSALAAADACIAILKPLKEYASTYPNKVFDYMAAGRPVALAIDGVIRDVVEAAGGGLFAAPGDAAALAGALRQLSGNREAARQMGMRGRQYLEQEFSRAAIADRLVEAMRRLVP